jgi:hypothetical protein
MPTISRRSAIVAPAAGLAAGLIASKAGAHALDDGDGDLSARRSATMALRGENTRSALARPFPHHPTNGDEEALRSDGKPSYIGNYTKGLPHNQFGEVEPAAYKVLLYEGAVTFADLNAPIFVPSDDGSQPKNLQEQDFGSYRYADLAPRLTITGELNKLASNIGLGRNFAGVHWRNDYAESILLGERVALEFLRERVSTYNENVSYFITKFDGSEVVISNVGS